MARQGYRIAALLAAVLLLTWSSGAAAVETATLAKTDDPAPGTGGATFSGFFGPVVNGAGQVAFLGTFSGGGEGMWLGGPAGLAPVFMTGDGAPGTGGAVFVGFANTTSVMNGAGHVAFVADLSDGSHGIWRGGPGGLALVARTGVAAPGAGGATFTDFLNPLLDGAGAVLLTGDLSDGGRGIWMGQPGGIVLVARDGTAAPGAGGTNFADFADAAMNSAGELAFKGLLGDGRDGIWMGRPSSLFPVALEGGAAPGAGGGATFNEVEVPAINGAGEVAFRADLSDGRSGLWAGRPGSLVLVAIEGGAAPGAGGGVTFDGLSSDPSLNGAGEVAFRGTLSDGGAGIWAGRPGGLFLSARNGGPAPGTPVSGTFAASFSNPGVNGTGEVAFQGALTPSGSVTPANDGGLWAGKPRGLQLIAREGDTIEVAPFDPRIVADSGLIFRGTSGNEGGRPSGFSEGGQAAFTARFTDGSSGVFLAPLQAPQAYLLSRRAIDSQWDTVPLPRSFTKPVVIAGPPSFKNKAPGVVRLRKVGATSFQAKFQEWKYLNGRHPEERLDFIVVQKGRRKLADGAIMEAGILQLSGNGVWKSKGFFKKFPGRPKVFLTIQTFRDRTPVALRVRKVTRRGFEAALFEEEKKFSGNHRKEKVGYLAIYSETNGGTIRGGVDGTAYALKQPRVKHRFKTVLGQRIKLEEEKSLDRERRHARERVAVMSLGRGHFAQQITDKEIDTTALRFGLTGMAAAQVAFPGAEGHGKNATGWRYGRILKVTNTDDSGPGSLRNCLQQQSGPRICLIETGGTVDLDSGIFVNPKVYLAGQTAPGDGIQLRLSGQDNGKSPIIIKNSENVVIRFLKSRPGPSGLPSPSVSALLVENSHDVMLDHLSLMFATDQVFSVHIEGGSAHNITLQKSIVAWGLQHANHPKGAHSKGALICSAVQAGLEAGDRCGRVTLWGNVFAHNSDRNPDVKSTGEPIEIVSNVFYDAKSQFGEFYDLYGNTMVNYIGNVVLRGPSTRSIPPPYSVELFDFDPRFSVSLYLHGNTHDTYRPTLTGAETLVLDPAYQGQILSQPFMAKSDMIVPPGSLLNVLANDVGAILPDGRLRDALDSRVIADIRNRTGSVIDHQSEVGGHPNLKAGSPRSDTDGDGMPDDWETALSGLQRTKFDAWDDRDGDGWSNIEEYLSVLAGDMPDPRK